MSFSPEKKKSPNSNIPVENGPTVVALMFSVCNFSCHQKTENKERKSVLNLNCFVLADQTVFESAEL